MPMTICDLGLISVGAGVAMILTHVLGWEGWPLLHSGITFLVIGFLVSVFCDRKAMGE